MNRVSVIIPTYNRLWCLQKVIQNLEEQTTPFDQFEVIIVSDGSSDGTHEFLDALQTPLNLTVIKQENQGVATARNNGVKAANGRILLFLDDDVVPTNTLIAEHLQAQGDREDLVVIGPMLNPCDYKMKPWVEWEQLMLTKQYDAMQAGAWEPTARQFYTGNTSLPKAKFEEAGGFDPNFRRAEDVELAYRLADLGVKFRFQPTAVGYHYADRSFDSWLNIAYSYGRNDVIFTKEKQQTWLLETVLREYHTRNTFIHLICKLGLDRPAINKLILLAAKTVGQITYSFKLKKISRMAYSSIFNLGYYEGLAKQLGGRQQFYQAIATSR
jgi:GT2 family glycosyltransferase